MVEDGKTPKPDMETRQQPYSYDIFLLTPPQPGSMDGMAGPKTAGIMDHDSLSGAKEFIEAGKIVE